MAYTVLYDEPHEAVWFKSLAHELHAADEVEISAAKHWPHVTGVLGYDRPDIVLLDDDRRPILSVEETVEVPSGHNVGQRFARLAAAAEHHVPCLYFGPYVAKKHGGETAGPRYMNLRLFAALDAMVRVTGTAVTTINWPVDAKCEVRRDRAKDRDVREYVGTLLQANQRTDNLKQLNQTMLASAIHQRMSEERERFALTIKRRDQYDAPPDSVQLLPAERFERAHHTNLARVGIHASEVVLYNVGMQYIRSDPYTGMAMLYHYLYVAQHSSRALVLWFPNIDFARWQMAARAGHRKDIRLFRHAAEAILFKDQIVAKANL